MCVSVCFWHLSNGRDRQEVGGACCQNFPSDTVQALLHTNACGDFLLLFSLSLSRISMHQTDLTSTFAFALVLVLVLPLLEVLGSAHQKCSGYT